MPNIAGIVAESRNKGTGMARFILIVWFLIGGSWAFANDVVNPLPADAAFTLSASYQSNQHVLFHWQLAPDVYLYRDKISFAPASNNTVLFKIAPLPKGMMKTDTLHGHFQAYAGQLELPVKVMATHGVLAIVVNYQGCSTAGFCYPPIQKILSVNLTQVKPPADITAFLHEENGLANSQSHPEQTKQGSLFAGQSLFVVLMSFLGIGLLLAFTPCSLPMLPILSGIIVGHGRKTEKKVAFLLSLTYVAGMALTYAIVGVVIALIGSSIQAQLQKPWIIVLLSGIFILLAMSLFGLYELQLPSRWQRQVTEWSNRQKGGTLLGVFFMGSLSTLIISPCVSAPLVGVLAYIGETGNVVIGASALLMLGIGMGIPLLLLGVSADRLLPKAGVWLTTIERLFGLLMLGVAIWMLSRMIPGPITLFLWALLLGGASVYLMLYAAFPSNWRWAVRGLGVGALVYAIILTIGSLAGNSDPLHPWEQLQGIFEQRPVTETTPLFTTIQSVDELNAALTSGKPVVLDFYADWCVSCVEMNRSVFSKSVIRKALAPYTLLRVDMTENERMTRDIAKRFGVVGPPTMIFFNRAGQELTSSRIVGEVNDKELLAELEKMKE